MENFCGGGGRRKHLRLISRQQSIPVCSSSREYIPDRRHSFSYRILRGGYRGWRSHAARSEDTNKLSAPCILVAVARTRKRMHLPSLCRTVASCRIIQVIFYRKKNKFAKKKKYSKCSAEREINWRREKNIRLILFFTSYLRTAQTKEISIIRYQFVFLSAKHDINSIKQAQTN